MIGWLITEKGERAGGSANPAAMFSPVELHRYPAAVTRSADVRPEPMVLWSK